MPSDKVVAQMYGRDYAAFRLPDQATVTTRVRDAIAVVEKQRTGRLIDYGCGDGVMLTWAARAGWTCLGVEFAPDIALALSERLGLPVVTPEATGRYADWADVLVLNDVLEHLVDLPERFASISRLLKPGGLLVAQGPLEGNRNLFTDLVATQRRLRRRAASTAPPYHLILATARGQRHFFGTFGLRELQFTVVEVAWPAPQTRPPLRSDPRGLALFCLRRASQTLGRLWPTYSGNRYLYVGTRLGDQRS
jgi:SAM-dependent methyltransferase